MGMRFAILSLARLPNRYADPRSSIVLAQILVQFGSPADRLEERSRSRARLTLAARLIMAVEQGQITSGCCRTVALLDN